MRITSYINLPPLSVTIMKESIRSKLEQLQSRFVEVSALLSIQETMQSQEKYVALSKEYAELNPVVEKFNDYLHIEKSIEETSLMMNDEDLDLRNMAYDDINLLNKQLIEEEENLSLLLLPEDPNDKNDVYLEIRAGAGGDESSIFAGDLLRMYSKYSESRKWMVEIISTSDGEHGGYKEVILRISGNAVYSSLKFESGVHRVQRVPLTEAQGRIHTSTCTIAVMPDVGDAPEIEINPSDLRIDTYRASGAGGQHVNRTDSAVRITHLPTGVVVECQDDRSQHKNKARAMSVLISRLADQQKQERQAKESAERRNLVGTGDRSERIRTYNFPQGRLTDHRINLTLYKLDEIMEGALSPVIDALRKEHQTDLLSSLSSSI